MHDGSFLSLLGRYLSFIWLFKDVPPRANLLERASIRRANRAVGMRYLPVYMRRYGVIIVFFFLLGALFETMPLACGACMTLSTVALCALVVALVGFFGLKLGAFERRG